MNASPLVDLGFAVPVFSLRDYPIACLNKPKRPRNATWYKDKAMLAEAQESGQILNDEQLAFLVDPGVPDGQDVLTIIPNNAAFQTYDLDTYDSDCQSDQTMYMLTKPQVFYDNIHKQDLGYQNPFDLKKPQQIKPTLYDGIVISAKHVAMLLIDDEETLILEEEGTVLLQNKNFRLNKLSGFNYPILPLNLLINHPLKYKFPVNYLRTTPDARPEGERGFEHTKAIFNNEITQFLESLKDMFNVFDKDLLNEIMKVQTFFDQIEATVQQSSVNKQCLEIAMKELVLKNDRPLQQIMSQDVLLTVMNSRSLNGESINIERKRIKSCDKCFNLDAELLKSQNAHNDLLKRITSANVVPPKKTTSYLVETQTLELKVYSMKPKNVKNVGSSKKAKIVESKNANHSESNHTWGSNAEDIPLSSSLIMKGCPNCSLVSELLIFETYDREPLSAYELSKNGLARGIAILKFQKDRLCLACALGKSKKSSHQPKAKDTNQEKLYLLHMDLCGPVRFLRSKDEALEAIIKCIKNIQVYLNATVRNVRTYNGTKFVNQTLRDFYENVGISHQTSVACTPQQNEVVKRQNRTLIEAART
nr:integrase, catalytic region, zinc finger, CCHC-type, peptidase aspartic, catalytic [Tanacetum cinerariifolium]